jgi:hypothetical protein
VKQAVKAAAVAVGHAAKGAVLAVVESDGSALAGPAALAKGALAAVTEQESRVAPASSGEGGLIRTRTVVTDLGLGGDVQSALEGLVDGLQAVSQACAIAAVGAKALQAIIVHLVAWQTKHEWVRTMVEELRVISAEVVVARSVLHSHPHYTDKLSEVLVDAEQLVTRINKRGGIASFMFSSSDKNKTTAFIKVLKACRQDTVPSMALQALQDLRRVQETLDEGFRNVTTDVKSVHTDVHALHVDLLAFMVGPQSSAWPCACVGVTVSSFG